MSSERFHYTPEVTDTGWRLPPEVVAILAERDHQLEDYLDLLASYLPQEMVEAAGDLIVGSGSGVDNLSAGADGTFLVANSAATLGLNWRVIADADLPATIARDTEVILQTLADAKGDMVAATAADTWAKVTVGADGTVLIADSVATPGVNWRVLADSDIPSTIARDSEVTAAVTAHEAAADPHTGYVLESVVNAKGDLYAGTADNTVTRIGVGTDGQALVADSTQTTGLRYQTITTSVHFTQGPWTQTNVAASQTNVGLNLH